MVLTNLNFQGIFRNRDMPHDCYHNDGLIITFFCRGEYLNVNITNPTTNQHIILLETRNFSITNHNHNTGFIIHTNTQGNYNELRGKMFGQNDGIFFKLFIPNYGWRYFEKFRD